jgi:hypothetical protein
VGDAAGAAAAERDTDAIAGLREGVGGGATEQDEGEEGPQQCRHDPIESIATANALHVAGRGR